MKMPNKQPSPLSSYSEDKEDEAEEVSYPSSSQPTSNIPTSYPNGSGTRKPHASSSSDEEEIDPEEDINPEEDDEEEIDPEEDINPAEEIDPEEYNEEEIDPEEYNEEEIDPEEYNEEEIDREEDGKDAEDPETESGKYVAGKPEPTQPTKQKEEEELGSGSWSARQSHRADPKSKTISSEQIDAHPNSRKPEARSERAAPSRKRRAVAESNENGSKKRRKRGAGDKKEQATFWSPDDVIILLKGLEEFAGRGRSYASSRLTGFHGFINRSLNFKMTSRQMTKKIWYLKSKYKIESKKVREGEKQVVSKPHEKLVYQLSKRIWGNDSTMEDDDDMEVENGKEVDALDTWKKGGGNVKRMSTTTEENGGGNVKRRRSNVEQKMKQKSPELMQKSAPKSLGLGEYSENDKVICDKVESEAALYPHLNQFLRSIGSLSASGLWESDVKRAFALMSPSEAKGLDQRWRKLLLKEREIHMERLNLVHELIKECYDLINSSEV